MNPHGKTVLIRPGNLVCKQYCTVSKAKREKRKGIDGNLDYGKEIPLWSRTEKNIEKKPSYYQLSHERGSGGASESPSTLVCILDYSGPHAQWIRSV